MESVKVYITTGRPCLYKDRETVFRDFLLSLVLFKLISSTHIEESSEWDIIHLIGYATKETSLTADTEG